MQNNFYLYLIQPRTIIFNSWLLMFNLLSMASDCPFVFFIVYAFTQKILVQGLGRGKLKQFCTVWPMAKNTPTILLAAISQKLECPRYQGFNTMFELTNESPPLPWWTNQRPEGCRTLEVTSNIGRQTLEQEETNITK